MLTLSQAHRAAQLALRSATLRDLLRLWSRFDLGRIPQTWPGFEDVLVRLIMERGRVSAGLSSAFYRSSRLSAGVAGSPPIVGPSVTVDEVVAGLRVMGPVNAGRQLALGRTAADVRNTTLVNVSGVTSKYVLDHGRTLLVNAVKNDPRARGWMREASGDSCEFCAMLAGRGAVYKGEESASFPSHRHCSCTAAPVW